MYTKFWSENMEERVHSDDLGIGGKVKGKAKVVTVLKEAPHHGDVLGE
jgi:hypothetical protein